MQGHSVIDEEILPLEDFAREFSLPTEYKEWNPNDAYEEPNPEEYSETPIVEVPEEKTEKEKLVEAQTIAELLTEGFDLAFSYGGKVLLTKTLFKTKEEYFEAKRVYIDCIGDKARKKGLSTEEKILYQKFEDFLDMNKETLPLDEEEKKDISEKLALILKEMNVELSPGWALLASVGIAGATRYASIKALKTFYDED